MALLLGFALHFLWSQKLKASVMPGKIMSGWPWALYACPTQDSYVVYYFRLNHVFQKDILKF
jgi:hypothetical protein